MHNSYKASPMSLQIPTRSYYSSHFPSSPSAHSAVVPHSQVRQQSISHTYKELSFISRMIKTPDESLCHSEFSYESPPDVARPQTPIQPEPSNELSPLLSHPTNNVQLHLPVAPRVTLGIVPAAFLGLVLNLLDAMSYGVIIFPSSSSGAIPETAIQAGIAMFFASTFVAQLVFSVKSGFVGCVGSMMIEVMPFLHIMARTVESTVSRKEAILPTIMFVYATSTVSTGLLFLALGKYRLGNVLQFFPRHILVGCIGGIGFFLLVTGVQVTTDIEPSLSFAVLSRLFTGSTFALWSLSLLLAVLLKLLQRLIHHELFVPCYYVILPVVFYLLVFCCGISLETLRSHGWLFDLPSASKVPFYTFWTYFDLLKIDFSASVACIPTILALTFFGILHVPINVPALSISTQQDVNINDELVYHGYSNLLAGICGTCQNYLGTFYCVTTVYSNSVLVYRSGGNSPFTGYLLAIGTALVWICGGQIVGYVPKIVVGALIFHLAIDLLKESVYDTWNVGMQHLEYLTVVSIIAVMGIFGFTEGILAGIVMACVFFVFMYSQRSVIRASFSGKEFRSSVHRLKRQYRFLEAVGDQIHVLRLQGFMFFGTINQLDDFIIQLVHDSLRLRYLILDFSLINGIDYSATEAFHRIKKLLRKKRCYLLFCGLKPCVNDILTRVNIFGDDGFAENDSEFGTPRISASSMAFIQLADEDENVLVFENLNQAMEWCENNMLLVYFRKRDRDELEASTAKHTNYDQLRQLATPRQRQLDWASTTILEQEKRKAADTQTIEIPQEFADSVLFEAFCEIVSEDQGALGISDKDMVSLCRLFTRVYVDTNTILWDCDDAPHELYVVETGELAVFVKDGTEFRVIETLLRGTMVGELEVFSLSKRSNRLVSQSPSVLWKLGIEKYESMVTQDPALALKFSRMALNFDMMRHKIAISYCSKL